MKKNEIKTEWNLGLLYKNIDDLEIERDVKTFEKTAESFEKKYKNTTEYLRNKTRLFKALSEYEKLIGMPESSRALNYLHFRKDLNSTDEKALALFNVLVGRLTKAGNKIVFFDLNLGKIPEKLQKEILKDPTFRHFQYFLTRIFLTAKYNLSEPEEKILNLKSLPSHALWVQGQEKVLSQQTVLFKGKNIPLPQAFNTLSMLPTKERHELAHAVNIVLKNTSYFAEAEINAIYTNKKINDELRGLTQPYSATILGYQNDEKSIINFVKTVTDNFSISHKFYALKAKLLKRKKLEYSDRAAKAGDITIKPTFEESIEILKSALTKVDQKYVTILDSYLQNGQIDVFPKKGKSGGAYCASDVGMPTFVLLNHVNNLDSLKTLAHEMGHAFHAEFSKSQPALYQNHTISVAEVASTLFENFAFDEVFETLSPKEKVIALHDRLNADVSTIFRQIACFNFELELHTQIRAKGALSKEEIASLHNKHMKAYLGPRFDFKELDGYFFVNWSHIRRFFYVYSYAYGELISKALYRKYRQDKNYMKEIEKFLSAGGSKSPEQIFKDIGIDTTKPEFFIEGLKMIEDDIKKLAKLLPLVK